MTFASATNARPLALVTGASSGIGVDLARELARGGHDLVLVARREAALVALAEELTAHEVNITVVAANLGVIDAASRLTSELQRRGLAQLDVLVNNAGFGDCASFVRAEPTKLNEMIQLNVAALTALTRACLPGMVARGRGRILLVADVAGFAPGPGAAVYHASKAYVLSLGEALDRELRGTGVTVTTLCPGPTRTGFQAVAGGRESALPRPRFGVMPSADVARQAYEALQRGKRILVPGWLNKLRAVWLRIAPHALTLAMAGSPCPPEPSLSTNPGADPWNTVNSREKKGRGLS